MVIRPFVHSFRLRKVVLPQLVAQWKLKRFKPHVVRVVAYLQAQVLNTKMRRTVLPALTAKVVLMDIAKHTHAMQRVSAYLRWRMRRTRYRRLVLHSLKFTNRAGHDPLGVDGDCEVDHMYLCKCGRVW
ncbi:Aste57867_20837 [Aphanomyces stellatus]|uniref:Aste57867_20837 protein n=1 Tax=Aphanomyces stellatus TaxID=120398 RepID=A0A485LG26_9STRA|nr:hypothetical protein As57867_020769 [Aphanomyces stellatus]VFT97515.1 Aste57867_20837 [Aphanomyces stellatus]